MAQEEKPQEPLKTPCRRCRGLGVFLLFFLSGEMVTCPTCKGTGYEEKP